MRRISINTIALAILSIVAAACVGENLHTDANISYEATIDTSDELTKTYMDRDRYVRWSSGDEIVVFEENIRGKHRLLEAYSGKISGKFEFVTYVEMGNVLSHNVAFYPYCEPTCSSVGNNAYILTDVTFPATQTYSENSFAAKSFPMVAISDDDELLFKHIGGALRLSLKGQDCAVKSVSVTGNNNEYLAGKADVIVSAEDDVAPKVNIRQTALKTVTLDCGTGVALNAKNAVDFILILPPVTLEKGFIVKVKLNTGEEMTKVATTSHSINRARLLTMPEITVESQNVETKVLTECPFKRGINISDWLLHEDEAAIRPNLYSEQDFYNLRSLGFDAVRLPVDFEAHVGAKPDYIISEYVLECIDRAVNWAENAGLYIVIDNHSYLGEDFPNALKDNPGSTVLKKVFTQVAERYKDRSDKVMYELFNEPNGDDWALKSSWGTLQPALIDIIRSVDKKHTIVVSGFGSHRDNLKDLKSLVSKDKNLLYTFHFYSPALFTHQGADWSDSPMQYLSGPVPFPYDATKMPPKPSQFVGNQYFESDYDDYPQIGNVEWVKSQVKTAADFASENNVPVYCGEWGVLNRLAAQDDYCRYHKAVREILEDYNIGWTLWAYRDDFSIFNRTGGHAFESNLNVGLLEALDLNIPAGYTSTMPSEITFYDDMAASFIKPSIYNYESEMTFESKYAPYSGDNCMKWVMGGKYASVSFEIWPVADISAQALCDYELTFKVRSESALAAPLTVRFIEYNKNQNTTWRYGFLLDKTMFAADGEWHEVRIRLSSFVNQGGYVGSTWQNADTSRPCDWTMINKLEFAVEARTALVGHEIYFDDIKIAVTDNKFYIDSFNRSSEILEWN